MINKIFILLSFALRDVSKSRVILALTIISLSSAFTAVFISAGVLKGFEATLTSGEVNSSGYLHIKPMKGKNEIENLGEIKKFLSSISNVSGYSVRSLGQADFEYNDRIHRPYEIVGINLDNEIKTSQISQEIIKGRFLNPNDTKSVVLGLTFSDILDGVGYDGKTVNVGEKINVKNLDGDWEKFNIVGIFDAKTFIPNWWAVFPKKEAESIDFRGKDSEIAVNLKDPLRMEEDRRLIQNNFSGITVYTWEEEAGYVKDILKALNFITGSISDLLIETTFVIMSVIIFINVYQRRRQIGILKSMGASNRFVVAIYILETMLYALLSYAIGFLIFMLIDIYSNNHPIALLIGDFHTMFVPAEALKLFFILVGASLAGGIIPSYIAARTKVADIIRNAI